MNILVCVKQVPDTTEIKIDPITNTLIRAGVPSILNPFDAYALEMALRIKDSMGEGRVIVLSMGPENAKQVIKEAFSVGADAGYLVSGREFGGSDTLATSYIISGAIKKIEETEGKFDLIFCGKQAIDGDTGQVGPELAEHLGYSQVTYAADVDIMENKAVVKRETDCGYEMIETTLPAVLTVIKTEYELRYATLKGKLQANKKDIPVISPSDLEKLLDFTRVGLKGSPTKVKKTFTPQLNKTGVKIKEETNEESVLKLVAVLSDAGLI
jgi:electron transfer flavoprotein beta subunit